MLESVKKNVVFLYRRNLQTSMLIKIIVFLLRIALGRKIEFNFYQKSVRRLILENSIDETNIVQSQANIIKIR